MKRFGSAEDSAARSFRVTALLLLFSIAAFLPSLASAAGGQCGGRNCIAQINGPAPVTLPITQVYGYAPIDWSLERDLDYVFDTPTYQGISGFNGAGLYSYNNKTATTDKNKDKAHCQGHVADPVEVDDGAKLLSIPLFQMSGEMGLKYVLYYHSVTSSSFWAFNPWASSISYALDLYCGFTDPNVPCSQVTLYRPDGSSVSFSGNHASYGNFPEIGGGGLATLVHNSNGTWTLHDEDSNILTFDTNGYFTSIKDVSGVGWTISTTQTTNDLSPDGTISPCVAPAGGVHTLCSDPPPPPPPPTTTTTTVVTHTDGQSFTIVEVVKNAGKSNESGSVTVTDPAGNQYNYVLGFYGVPNSGGLVAEDISSLTFPGLPATTMTFSYTGANQLLSGVSYNGTGYWSTGYNSNNRVSSDGAADGTERTSIVYSTSSGSMVATITNPLGLTTTNRYTTDSQGNYLLASVSNSAVQGCGSTTNSMSWDGNDNLTRTVDNDGITHTYSYAANGQLHTETEASGTAIARTINYVWDPNAQLNRILSITVPGESEISYAYNAQNRLASVTHTNLTGIGTPNQSLVTTYAYTLYGNGMVETMTVAQPSPNGSDHTTYAYDTHGNLTSTTDGLGYVTTYSNYNALDEVGKVVGPNGDETDYTYDARGRVASKTTHPYGATATWTYGYDGFGLLSQVNVPDGEVMTWGRDAEQRVKTITHNDKDGASTETFAYDANGDVISDVIARGSDIGKSTSYVYNALGKIYQVKGSHGQVLTYGYDGNGNVLSVTNALGYTTRYAYDALNRLIGVTDAAGGITSYAYDAGDHVTAVEDPRGLTTTYSYDGFGHLWQQASPDTGTTTFLFDAYGRREYMTRANGNVLGYDYDGLNRLTAVVAGNLVHTFAWDTCANGKGQLCSTSTGSTTVGYSYTPEGWITGRSFSISGGLSYALGYSYDNMGHLAVVAYPDGNKAEYSYLDGAVASVGIQIGANYGYAASNISYRPMDLAMSSWTSYYNSAPDIITYDSDLRPTSITMGNAESLAFTYDAANRIVQLSNGVNSNLSASLGYDALNRLVAYSSPIGNESYAYDADGNRTYEVLGGSATALSYASGSNQLVSTSGAVSATYGYDADGNTTTINGLTAYQYGPFNHLLNAAGVSYAVSAEGQRLSKTGGSIGTYYFAPDASGALLAEDQNGHWQDYVWLNGRLEAIVTNGSIFPTHDDQTGRPEAITNPYSYATLWQSEGLPFNSSVSFNEWGTFNLGFPGQYYDSESGLWHNGNRDYDADLGRYIEPDPLGLGGGINPYVYADNDPISNVDPLGLQCTIAQRVLQAIGNFLASHVDDSLTFDAGYGFGVEGSVTVTRVGQNVQVSGRVGLGIGIGFGTAVTANAHIGDPTGWGVQGSVVGGDAFAGGQASASVADGGPGASAGVGLGLGAGGTATVGYSGNIGSFHAADVTAGGSGCGCSH